MERRLFELEQGYLNIDQQALYLTRSGNWERALSAPEWSSRNWPMRIFRYGIGMALLAGGVLINTLQLVDGSPVSIMLMLGLLGLGLLSMYHSMRHDLITDRKIPFNKVLAWEQVGTRWSIQYLDRDGHVQVRSLRLPPEAIEYLAERMPRSRAT
jgi:hypothetical protein